MTQVWARCALHTLQGVSTSVGVLNAACKPTFMPSPSAAFCRRSPTLPSPMMPSVLPHSSIPEGNVWGVSVKGSEGLRGRNAKMPLHPPGKTKSTAEAQGVQTSTLLPPAPLPSPTGSPIRLEANTARASSTLRASISIIISAASATLCALEPGAAVTGMPRARAVSSAMLSVPAAGCAMSLHL